MTVQLQCLLLGLLLGLLLTVLLLGLLLAVLLLTMLPVLQVWGLLAVLRVWGLLTACPLQGLRPVLLHLGGLVGSLGELLVGLLRGLGWRFWGLAEG